MPFTKQVRITVLCYLALITITGVIAFKHNNAYASAYSSGIHYQILDQAETTHPEVKIFFTPYCRPCAIVHTPLRSMAERAGIKFIDVPVSYGPNGKDIQQSIISAEYQGIGKAFVKTLMENIHNDKYAFKNREELAQLIEQCGGDAQDFRNECKQLTEDAEHLDVLASEYYIKSTPTIVVNGNKQINLGSLKSFKDLENILIELSGV